MQLPDNFPESTDALELQVVLTRYVDSTDGFQQAAELMSHEHLAAAFREVSQRRREVAGRVARLISNEGEKPDLEGSHEGAVHRWWIRLRDSISAEDIGAVLSECLRGEKTLLAAMEKALDSEALDEEQAGLLHEAAEEVALAIQHFSMAIEE